MYKSSQLKKERKEYKSFADEAQDQECDGEGNMELHQPNKTSSKHMSLADLKDWGIVDKDYESDMGEYDDDFGAAVSN